MDTIRKPTCRIPVLIVTAPPKPLGQRPQTQRPRPLPPSQHVRSPGPILLRALHTRSRLEAGGNRGPGGGHAPGVKGSVAAFIYQGPCCLWAETRYDGMIGLAIVLDISVYLSILGIVRITMILLSWAESRSTVINLSLISRTKLAY